MSIKKKEFQPQLTGPLEGIRVIDLSRLVSGNTLTLMLADLGAEVVKVEPPRGDSLRAWVKGGISTDWKSLARNKKSIGLDLRQSEGMNLLKRLVAKADVLVENFRAGTLEKMGLAPALLHEINPRLVIARITGFGQTGPYAKRPGFGTLVEGMCGMAEATGFADGPPILPPGPLADTCAGYCGALAVLAAVREVEVNGGRGQIIDQPLFNPLFIALGAQAANYRVTGKLKVRNANQNLYMTRDHKYVTYTASMEPMPQRMLEAIGKGEYNKNPEYAGVRGRNNHGPEIKGWVQDYLGQLTQEEAVRFFEEKEISGAPVYTVAQIMEDPHFQEAETVVELPDEEMGYVPMYGFPNRLSGSPSQFFRPAPKIGEHNREVVAWAELDEDEIASLEEKGVLHTGKKMDRSDFSYQ
ncbi:CaiB/BaiF CoA transferase family protein [Candidimonas nitroreducens]|uniref:CoA transferase n=1 Tax=Candidimonas nitroreducens TaxID=683354 RepID=A0A225MHH7_9BURK|nr:CoA transferase [Candidimonas nitroreducens]OWT58961.1 CoA transferase [Candidimonas nitroreducens]